MEFFDCNGCGIKVNDVVEIFGENNLRDIQARGWTNAELDSYYVVRRVDTFDGCIYTDQSDHGFRSYRFKKVATAPVKSRAVAPIGGPIEITAHRCGACGVAVDNKSHGAYTYPHSEIDIGQKIQLREVQFFCSPCAKSIAEHIQYLKVNHGPTRTGRT